MPAEWRKVPGKRVKGYTKANGQRVKGYIRKRPAPRLVNVKDWKPKPLDSVADIQVTRMAAAIYRPKGDKAYFGEQSHAVLENVATELQRTLGAKRVDIDSVWRCDFRLPTMTVARLIELLVNVNDVDLEGGKVGLAIYLRIKGREIMIPFAKARYSLTETAVEGAETLIKQIMKYLPELGASDDDDSEEEPNPIEVFAKRSAASRKGAETKRKRCKHRRKSDNKRCVRDTGHKGKHKYKDGK